MKYELGKIDSLIEKYLSQNSTNMEKELLENAGAVVLEIDNEITRIKKSFSEQMFNLKNDKQVERYVQRHQSCLIRLCDNIIQQISPESFRKKNTIAKITSTQDLRNLLYNQLEHVLSYIERYFGKYFNLNEAIPNSYRIIGQLEFREKLQEYDLPENCKLLDIARHPVDDFISQNKNISFRRLIYLKELLKELESKCSGCKECRNDCKLSCSLIYLNFNSFGFFSHLTSIVKEEIEKETELTKRIEKLSFHQKKLNQAQLKPNFAYKPKQESIRDKVGNWIYEEIVHLEKIYQLTLKFPNEQIRELDDEFKLITDLSVPHVAYFVRILVETGVIRNKNQKEVITFFAKHFKTKKAEKISVSSLHNKYYNIDTNIKEDMRERIIKLLNETQKPD